MTKLAVLYLCFVVDAHSEDWSQFRGPSADGHTAVTNLPVRWSKKSNIAWRQKIPGSGWSSPIVYKDRLYLTSAVEPDGGGLSLEVYCLNIKTGKGVWRTPLFSVDKKDVPKMHSKNSHATPTPTIDGDELFIHFGSPGTACLDLNGKIKWKTDSNSYPPVHGGGSSPVLVDKKVIFSCDGAKDPFVLALHRDTGKVAWKVLRNMNSKRTFSFCTPLVTEVDGKKQVVSPGSDAVFAYNPADGSVIWKVQYPGGCSVVPRPVFVHGLVYVCTGFNQPSLLAIKPNGSGDVTATHVAWKTNKGVPHTPSLLVVGDELYMVSDNGIASCLDAKTGEEIWKERLGGNYSSSPIHSNGRLYFLSEDGKTTVVQAGKQFKVNGTNELDERTLSSFAVADGALFIRTEESLYRIGRNR